MKRTLILFLYLCMPLPGHAAVKVVTTLPDLADFAKQIGGDKVQVDFIARGNQNPHFIEVKPSYMIKLRSADIFLEIGMELELWAPQIIDGSRNANLQVVDLSKNIQKLEVPAKVDASQGDVHPLGNPHYWLDPRNIRTVCGEIAAAFVRVDPANEKFYRGNMEAYLKKLEGKIHEWEAVMKPFAGRSIITFHKSWSYFTRWLGINVAEYIEPKPGIQPSPSHSARLIGLVRQGGIKAIVVEPFYDDSAPRQIASAGGAKVVRLATSVGGVDAATDYISLMDYNVRTLAEALK